jgi:hypothetical protein
MRQAARTIIERHFFPTLKIRKEILVSNESNLRHNNYVQRQVGDGGIDRAKYQNLCFESAQEILERYAKLGHSSKVYFSITQENGECCAFYQNKFPCVITGEDK